MRLQRKYSRREEIQISNIVSEISQIKEMKLGSDVCADVKLVFSCGKSLLAHQLVLGAASPVLMELLLQTSDTSTTSEDLVNLVLADFDFVITRQLLELMYCGEVALEKGQLGQVVEYGRLLDIPVFREASKEELKEETLDLQTSEDRGQFFELWPENSQFKVLENIDFVENQNGQETSQPVPLYDTYLEEKQKIGEKNEESPKTKVEFAENADVNENEVNAGADDSDEDSKEETFTGISERFHEDAKVATKYDDSSHKSSSYAGDCKKCPDCDYETKWSGTLNKHRLARHEEFRYECEICEAKFVGKHNLRNHKLAKHDGVSFPCNQCDYTSLSVRQLKTHVQSKHEGVRHTCKQCDLKFSHKSTLKKHAMAVHLGVKFSCKHCDKEFPRHDGLSMHVRKYHELNKRYDCADCGKQFLHRSYLKKHTKAKHSEVKYTCTHCGEEFSKNRWLSLHIRNSHEKGERAETMFPCDICEERFKHKATLTKHRQAKHLGVKFECQYCGSEFPRQRRLKHHIRKYHEVSKNEEVRYPCIHCKQTYRFENSLKYHIMAEHLGIRYHCEFCSQQFRRQSSLKDHSLRCNK